MTKKAVKRGSMLIDERRQHLLAKIQRDGRVLVWELSDQLGISRITIRKDLEFLQSRGLVQRSHGGAIAAQPSALFDPSLPDKQKLHPQEKLRIANAAVKLVEEGQCVILDSGTTTTAIASALRQLSRLTVITNAVNIAAALTDTDFEVILVGGTLRKNSFSLVGPFAEEFLKEMHADVLFLGVDGFDPKVGLTTPNISESRVNRAMVEAAKTVVAVCDSTKFGKQSLALIVPPQKIDMVITDDQIPAHHHEYLEKLGVQVIIA